MIKDGKSLEYLVRQIEELLLPKGFSVKGNQRVFNEDGEQIAEFDVEIRGKLGSTNMAWLIECRDRPSHGPAPGSWIEQLSGRQRRFGFNKVTAVSTTGFAPSAIEAGKTLGIELRSVKDISASDVTHWMAMKGMTQHIRSTRLDVVQFLLSKDEPPERVKALGALLKEQTGDARILRSVSTGHLATPAEAFQSAALTICDPFDGLEENGNGNKLKLHIQYPNDDDHFVIDTSAGPTRIVGILFEGEFSLRTKFLPVAEVKEYKGEGSEPISQSVVFPIEINREDFAIEFHHMGESGETHVLLRKLR